MTLQELFLSKLNLISQIDENYSLEVLGYKHTDDILSWRNNPNNLELFENTSLITRDSQNKFIDNYISLDRVDLVLNFKGEAVGVFNIKNLKEKPEYGSLIGDINFRGKGLGTIVKKNIIQYWFEVLNQKEIYVKIKSQNQFLIDSNIKLGFKFDCKEGELTVLKLTKN